MPRTGYDILGGGEKVEGVPSICGLVLGGPQPYRGLAAGTIELVAAIFFPTPLRIVVGAIGAIRVAYGLARLSDGPMFALAKEGE